MGRPKIYYKRILIGLDDYQAKNLDSMSKMLGMTYSEIISYLMDLYQLGKLDAKE